MTKIAKRRVAEWQYRHLSNYQLPVYLALVARQNRGYTLQADELGFINEMTNNGTISTQDLLDQEARIQARSDELWDEIFGDESAA